MADGYISQIKTPDNKVYDFRDQHLKVYTGSCTTAAGTAIKDVTTDGEFTLAKGAVIFVNFSTTNTAAVANLKLRVNSSTDTDAKPIKHQYNASEANLPGAGYLRANQTYQFYYDGTNWVTDVGRDANSTYSYMRPYENTGKGSYNNQGENPVKTGAAGWKFQLSAGKYFMYSHYYDNTAKSALTLNIGSTGAKPIYINGQPSSADNYTLPGGQYLVYYDGTNYYFRTDDKMTGNITGNAATATTATTAGAFSSGTTVELTGDTTGKSSSSTKGWSLTTTTKLLSGTLEADAALVTAPDTGKIRYSYNVNRGTTGLFENSNNANSIITLNRHSGSYESQLGFSSNGNIYYRNFTGVALNNTASWKQLAFTDSTVARANAVAWANVESKPDTATRWPQWDEIAAGADALREGTSNWTDHTEILTSYASNNGFADTNAKGVVYRRDAICAYNYIKGKLDSVYVAKSAGITNIAWDSTDKKITKTINGTTSDVVTAETLKAAMNITAADLNISNALHFIGITSTILADGSTTTTLTPKSTGSLNKTTGFVDGDVVMDGDQLREYVWSGDAWRLLGITTSTAYTQPTSTATNTWIAQISQGTDGKITATTGSLDTSGTWSGNAGTATKFAASKTIWGQAFDGTNNVTGDLIGVGDKIKLLSEQSEVQFLTSNSGAANGKFGKLGLSDAYSNIDFTNYILDVHGKARIGVLDGGQHVINGNVQLNSQNGSYNEGLRINRSTTGYANIYLGGTRSSTSGSQTGGWWIGTLSTPADATSNGSAITNTIFTISNNSTADTLSIKGTRGATIGTNSGWAIKPRLAIGTTYDTNYTLKVAGMSWLQGPLRIGNTDAAADTGYATANSGSTNYIAFYGVNGDGPGWFNHTYIGESIYGPKDTANEKSELLLFKGNDVNATSGPDRIRLFANEVDIQVYTSTLYGTWDTVRATTGTQVANFKNGQVTITGNLVPEATNTRTLGTSSLKWNNVYATTFTGNLTGNVTGNVSGSSGSCTGNAATADKLAAAVSINGTDFDGSANITTANWGTAQDITIGGTKKSVNGSQAYTWTNNEINRIQIGSYSDHQRVVIGLCELSAAGTGICNNWHGKIYRVRNNGLVPDYFADIDFNAAYGVENGFFYSLITDYENTNSTAHTGAGYRACVFKYNSKYYGGLEFFQNNAATFYVNGVGEFTPFMVIYYNTSNSTIINSEIDDSITFSTSQCMRQYTCGIFKGSLEGSATTATTSTWTTLLKPIYSTTTATASSWNIPSGSKQVWGERFSDSTLKYTPSGGSETTVTDTGDWTMWLTPSATANTATLNMRIDGTYYGSFSGNLSGNATTATAANLTSTANAVAYYTNTTGTFGSKASANGALYATSANGALQWGTLPIAQGGTGVTSFTKNHVILSDNTNGTTGLTSRAYSDSTAAGALSSTSTNFVTERDVYFGLPTLNNAHNYTSSSTYYAPTTGGTAGHILIGAGATTAPAWYGGTVMSGSAAASWKTAFNGTTDASSSTAAAVTIAGGLGVKKKLYVGDTATVPDLTIGSTNEYGDAYTPIYWHEGVPTTVTLVQQCAFTIKSGKSGVKLSHAAITANSYVTQIVVTSGEANLNSAISWTSAAGYIELTCSGTVSGDVTGYIMISRGGEITATATDIA